MMKMKIYFHYVLVYKKETNTDDIEVGMSL